MSLINEALQKIRAQEARQTGTGVGVPFPFAPVRRSGVGIGILIVSAVTLLIAISIGIGTWIMVAGRRPNSSRLVANATPVPAPTIPNASVSVSLPSNAPANPRSAAPALPSPVAPTLARPSVPTLPQPNPSTLPRQDAPNLSHSNAPTPPSAEAPPRPVVTQIDVQTLEVPGMGKVRLAGVARSTVGSRAILNNTIVCVGDQWGDVAITEIHDRRVVVKVNGKSFTLRMP